ncbi:MAG: hypothetical protein ACREV0_09725 [Burkholderiales bacterium]
MTNGTLTKEVADFLSKHIDSVAHLELNRAAQTLIVDEGQESTLLLYIVRLFAFLVILWAIIAKNREGVKGEGVKG